MPETVFVWVSLDCLHYFQFKMGAVPLEFQGAILYYIMNIVVIEPGTSVYWKHHAVLGNNVKRAIDSVDHLPSVSTI